MLGLLKKILGTKQERDMRRYESTVAEINRYFESYRSLSNDELRQKTLEFRQRIADYLREIDEQIAALHEQALQSEDFNEKEALFKEVDDMRKERDKALEEVLLDILPEAFAVVRETARRFTENEEVVVTATEHDRALAARPDKTYVRIEGDRAVWKNRWVAAGGDIVWNMVHYDVQLIGGIVLHEGKIAEMATGEGKTLVATLPAYLNGLSGEGVHVVTVNDYLARRDQEWVGPIYEFLLLTVDCIDKYRPHSPERVQAYRCDITFGTNAEFGFDYLRDNMVISADELVQRKHHYAIVDEVDSVLIDEARTPLIISGPVTRGAEDQEYVELNPTVKRLYEEQVRLANQFLSEARRLFAAGKIGYEEGEAGLPLLRAHRALPKYRPLIKFLSEEGVKVLLQKTEDFYMQENNKRMPEVDRELLFHIDEKNRSVELTDKGLEYLSRFNNDPNFFILPDIGSELVNIDNNPDLSPAQKAEAKERLSQDYGVKSRRIHAIQQLLKAYALFEKDNEYIVTPEGEVKIVDEQTGRIMEGRRYSDGLHQAIEAKENVKVGEITQTYATITLQNYFRMYHKLAGMTGTAITEAEEFYKIYKLDVIVIPTHKPVIRIDHEDLVFRTKREKYNAVIQKIKEYHKKGQPVLVGTTSVEVSEMLSRMLQREGIPHNVLNARRDRAKQEALIVAQAGQRGAVTIATNMAGRGTDIKLGPGVKELGGLAIIGTERHESRRIDLQLRGRAGRQGDPGESQFYVSLEDDLMRLFGSERIARIMDRLKMEEGEVITHPWVTKSIERAQKKVEQNNFAIRKRQLEFDDVLDAQRRVIYGRRRHALTGERTSHDVLEMLRDVVAQIVEHHYKEANLEAMREEVLRTLAFDYEIDRETFARLGEDGVVDHLYQAALDFYRRKREMLAQPFYERLQEFLSQDGLERKPDRVVVDFTDGRRILRAVARVDEALRTRGQEINNALERTALLHFIDEHWTEHLRELDELKEGINLRAFGQRDPLVEYKVEGFRLFQQTLDKINRDTISFIFRAGPLVETRPAVPAARTRRLDPSRARVQHESVDSYGVKLGANQALPSAAQRDPTVKEQPVVVGEKIGRNDPCPCGSGKKYKHCHGRNR